MNTNEVMRELDKLDAATGRRAMTGHYTRGAGGVEDREQEATGCDAQTGKT